MATSRHTVAGLVGDLRTLGVVPGDVVMVHASLRAVGPVVGGAAGLVAALDAAVGPSGSLLMTVGARDDWAWVNERPEAERAALLAGSPPFDARAATADPDVGVLAEVFRDPAGHAVSDHPEGRFAGAWPPGRGPRRRRAVGRLLRAGLSAGAAGQTRGGMILRLGADPDTVTAIHFAEYLADVPSKRRVRRHRLVHGPDGPVVRVVDSLDDSDGIVDHPGSRLLRRHPRRVPADRRGRGSASSAAHGASCSTRPTSCGSRRPG